MPIVSKSLALQKNGKLKKGFREVLSKSGRTMYFSDVKKPSKTVVDKTKKATNKVVKRPTKTTFTKSENVETIEDLTLTEVNINA